MAADMKKSDEDYKSYQEELQRQVEEGDRKDAARHEETSSLLRSQVASTISAADLQKSLLEEMKATRTEQASVNAQQATVNAQNQAVLMALLQKLTNQWAYKYEFIETLCPSSSFKKSVRLSTIKRDNSSSLKF